MFGVYFLWLMDWVDLSIKPGSWGMNGVGGLIFGVGLAISDIAPEPRRELLDRGRSMPLSGALGG